MSGSGQPGNKNAAKAKRWKAALERALATEGGGTVDAGLDKIAIKRVHQAFAGDRDAIEDIANRLDGKPAQAIIGGDTDDAPVQVQARVVLVRPIATEHKPEHKPEGE